jgi:hypothetical protein
MPARLAHIFRSFAPRGGGRRALAALAAGAATALLAWPSVAAPRYEVNATLGADGQTVAFSERVTAPPAIGGRLLVWLYADRQRRRPPSFDDFTADRLFPLGESTGGYGPLHVGIDGCPDTMLPEGTADTADAVRGRVIELPVCASARTPLSVTISGSLALARRYGTLGRGDSDTSLGDPWYPLLLEARDREPPLASHHVRLASEARRLLAAPGAAAWGAVEATLDAETHLPAFALDDGSVTREVSRGVELIHVTRRPPVPRGTDRGDPVRDGDPFDPDAARQIQAAAKASVALLRRLGFVAVDQPAPRGMRRSLTVVEIDERQRIGIALPGLVAVSDRAFRVIKFDAARRFHRTALSRYLFSSLLSPHVRAADPAADEAWSLDMYGALLADMSLEAGSESRDTPRGLIGAFAFMPSIDQLLYARKVPFRSVYFHDIDEHDPDRDGARRALDDRPSGHLMLEKLRDLLGPERFARAADRMLFRGQSVRAAAEGESGEPLGWFFSQWLAGKRRVAYRLAGHRSEAIAGGGHRHTIDVERSGETWVREPVVVEVVDDDGAKVRGRWDAAGPRGQVTLVTRSRLRDVFIDPDHRLVQDPSLSTNHPRFDDELRHSLRPPVFTGFSLSASLADARLGLDVDAIVKRRYDVREGVGLRAAYSYRGLLGSARYIRGLGELRDLNSTINIVSVGALGLRSTSGFGGSNDRVTQGELVVAFAHDTRRQIQDPAIGRSIMITAGAGAARTGAGKVLPVADVVVRGQVLFWPHVQHILAFTYGGALVRCPALPQSLAALSGRQGLRGYELDELLGCSTVYGIFEERWGLIKGPYVSNAGLSFSHKLELVPFVGAGFLSSQKTPTDLFSHLFLDGGLGLRLHYDNFGVAPVLLALDVGFPLSRRDPCRPSDDGTCVKRNAVGLWASFEQTF